MREEKIPVLDNYVTLNVLGFMVLVKPVQTNQKTETWMADSLYYVLQNILIRKRSNNTWHCNNDVTKKKWQNLDLHKTKQIIIQKVLTRAIQK